MLSSGQYVTQLRSTGKQLLGCHRPELLPKCVVPWPFDHGTHGIYAGVGKYIIFVHAVRGK